MIRDLSPKELLKLAQVISEIKHIASYTTHDETIVYPSQEDLDRPLSQSSLSSEERRYFVNLLQYEGAVKVVYVYTYGRREKPYRWTLETIQPRLNELESEVKERFASHHDTKGLLAQVGLGNNAPTQEANEPVLREAIFATPTYSTRSRKIADQFSPENHQFVLMVLKEIVPLVDFSTDGEVHYRLQSLSGDPDLMKERSLLKRFEAQGLFKHIGEDDISGTVTLSDLDIVLIKEVVGRLEELESGVITSDEFEEIKKESKDFTTETKLPPDDKSKQPTDLQVSSNRLVDEIKSSIQQDGSRPIERQKQTDHSFPSGWELVEDDNTPKIVKDGSDVFIFPNNWSSKYKYFRCLWESYGVKKDYKEVYEFESKLKYPEKGVWKINRNIRGTINKLRKEFENKKLPIHIETNKGFTLTIS